MTSSGTEGAAAASLPASSSVTSLGIFPAAPVCGAAVSIFVGGTERKFQSLAETSRHVSVALTRGGR